MDNFELALMIGESILESRERRRQYVKDHEDEWKATGQMFREARQKLCISLRDISAHIGFSSKTIAAFEAGRNVRNRKYLEPGYILALEYIMLERNATAKPILMRCKNSR